MEISVWRGSLLLISAVLCAPLLIVVSHLFIPEVSAWQHLRSTVLADYVANSLTLTLGVGIGTLLIGSVTAWCMTHYEFAARRILRWSLLLPLAMPAYIIAYTYTGMLDVAGPVQQLLREWFNVNYGDYYFPEIRSLPAAILLMSLVLYPYVYILARTAFSEQSQRMREVSSLHGRTSASHFWQVSLPLARPALFTGAALAMMEALADYGTVHYFGINTFTTGIFRSWYAMGNRNVATQLAAILCLFVLLVLVFEQHSRQKLRFYQQGAKQQSNQRDALVGWKSALVSFLCALPVILGFVIPVVQLLWWSASQYEQLWARDFVDLITTTFSLGILTAVLVVVIAIVFSYQQRWSASSLSRWQLRLLSLGYAIPGMVIAVGVLIMLGWGDAQLNHLSHTLTGDYVGLVLSGTAVALILAYCIRFLSIALQNTESGMMRISPAIDDAASTLGAGKFRLLAKIHTPLLRASVISAALLVFVDVLKELPATLVLRPFNVNTLAVRAYELASDERLIDAALPAITIVLVGLIPIVVLTKALDKGYS
ncbi:ABC transporter permease [Alteromonas oceanisediminis]|uniref:ABC transporter permease n=1 Tax=Alteromonas oceanisediminis TaxID=2836180 RepID=UPI001BD975E8|nr:iron ABC transporter permease [Alteromonas oceanisediminis]MBT0587548.1 iron ABC transporter permease [Alteromonas oceanisediminis]